MRKFLIFIIMIFAALPVRAQNVIVESETDVTAGKSDIGFAAKIVQEGKTRNEIWLEENAVIRGKIVKITEAKRGKRNGYIVIRPVSCEKDGTVTLIEDENLEAKVVGYSKKNFREAGLKAGLAVGGYFVKGLGHIFYFSKGLIIPNDGKSRISSAIHNVYENTPFVYIEKGQDVNIEKGDLLVLKFYRSNSLNGKIIERQK